MPGTVVTLRLSERDLALMDRYVENGEFVSRSELIRFALKRTLSDLMGEEIEARHVLSGPGALADAPNTPPTPVRGRVRGRNAGMQ